MRMACASRAFSSSVRISRALAQSSARDRSAIHGLILAWKPSGKVKCWRCRHSAEDFAEIVGAIAGKIDGLGKTSGKAGIGVDEAAHFVGIAGDDHHDAVAVVLHEFQQRVDRFPAEISARSGRARKRIGFVDEENAIQRLVALLQHFGRGLPDKAGDDVGAVNLDQMPDAQRPQRAIDISERARDLGLADAGRPGEHHVQAERRRSADPARAAFAPPAAGRSGR